MVGGRHMELIQAHVHQPRQRRAQSREKAVWSLIWVYGAEVRQHGAHSWCTGQRVKQPRAQPLCVEPGRGCMGSDPDTHIWGRLHRHREGGAGPKGHGHGA